MEIVFSGDLLYALHFSFSSGKTPTAIQGKPHLAPCTSITSELIWIFGMLIVSAEMQAMNIRGRATLHLLHTILPSEMVFPSPSSCRQHAAHTASGSTTLKRTFAPAAWFAGYVMPWESFLGAKIGTSCVLSCRAVQKCQCRLEKQWGLNSEGCASSPGLMASSQTQPHRTIKVQNDL